MISHPPALVVGTFKPDWIVLVYFFQDVCCRHFFATSYAETASLVFFTRLNLHFTHFPPPHIHNQEMSSTCYCSRSLGLGPSCQFSTVLEISRMSAIIYTFPHLSTAHMHRIEFCLLSPTCFCGRSLGSGPSYLGRIWRQISFMS